MEKWRVTQWNVNEHFWNDRQYGFIQWHLGRFNGEMLHPAETLSD